MYKIGDLIIYGSTGVCEVTDITTRYPMETEKEQLYYFLRPLYENYTVITPVNTTKVFMRPVISRKEAEELIDGIPDIEAEAYHNRSLSQLTQHYKDSISTHDCADLLELSMSIREKKRAIEKQKRKFGAIDQRFMKRAEDLLFGEMAVALDIPKEKVSKYINKRLKEMKKE